MKYTSQPPAAREVLMARWAGMPDFLSGRSAALAEDEAWVEAAGRR